MHYETRRNLFFMAIALVFAAIAAALATRWMQSRVDAVEATKKGLAHVVIAARDVPMGRRIEAADIRLVAAAADDVPADSYRRADQVVGQVTRSQLYSGEMLVARRLSRYSGGSALAAVVAPELRAVTVRVDDVIGVGGFILPENRVDVIAAYHDGAASKAETILSDVRVLAVDQRSDPQSDGPVLSRAVTLEVTPDGAERIAAAKQRGSIQLTLRNPMTRSVVDPLDTAKLAPPVPVVIAAGLPVLGRSPDRRAGPRAASRDSTVTLIRGTNVTNRIPE